MNHQRFMSNKNDRYTPEGERPSGMADEINRLRALSLPDLLEEHQRLFGKPPRLKRKDFVWRRCAWRIQEIRMGGLSKKAKQRLEELIAGIEEELGWLAAAKGERQHSSAPTTKTKTTARSLPAFLAKTKRQGSPRLLPGTSLVRDYKQKRHVVRVLERGFEWEGERFLSLSAVAKAISGSHCSGLAFFGLTKRKERA